VLRRYRFPGPIRRSPTCATRGRRCSGWYFACQIVSAHVGKRLRQGQTIFRLSLEDELPEALRHGVSRMDPLAELRGDHRGFRLLRRLKMSKTPP
jgi:hypothetical protein